MSCPKGRWTDPAVSGYVEREGNVDVDISPRNVLPEGLLGWTTVRKHKEHSHWRGGTVIDKTQLPKEFCLGKRPEGRRLSHKASQVRICRQDEIASSVSALQENRADVLNCEFC
jgi:hypothetical protein